MFATDLINEVGPKGSFLNKRHTAKNIRKELWFPTLLDRENYDNWLKADSTDMEKRCRKHKEELLAKHEPTPLDDDVKNDLGKIIEDAKRNLSKQP
ncbi:MAG: trimethylamine methyltransferase family protein [Promethearchaeota archaeon]